MIDLGCVDGKDGHPLGIKHLLVRTGNRLDRKGISFDLEEVPIVRRV
jgi:hypothetical protein